MLCHKPYLRIPDGVKRLDTVLSRDAKLAVTPFGCGQCIACRINRARIWTTRILLESKEHLLNSFVTLTYNDDLLPVDCKLCKRDVQLFLKRLRRKMEPLKVRYYCVGEYGDKNGRPHYHLMLFGVNDPRLVEECWKFEGYPMGHVLVGDVTKDSARYVTGYLVKDDRKVKEWMTCSRKPGLGASYVARMGSKVRESGFHASSDASQVRIGGKNHPIGRYLAEIMSEASGIPMGYGKIEGDVDDIVEELEGEGVYRDRLLARYEGARKSQENRHKILKSARRL